MIKMNPNTILFEEAFQKVMSATYQLPTETIDLTKALGRILGKDIVSDTDMPPFNKSAMDGYACKMANLQNELSIIETIPAGVNPKKHVHQNECSKIMTGAVVPEGADCVIMIEYADEINNNKIKFTGKQTSQNICFKGEDITQGDCVLTKGTLITPGVIAVLATVGCDRVTVSSKLKAGIIATGSELVQVKQKLDAAMIRNSNSVQLFSQCMSMGVDAIDYGIAKDSEDALDRSIKKAMMDNDLIILSGGVSMGDFDLVPDILKKNGFDFLFESVAMQPGRPTVFGKHKDKNVFCCGLPGNPVSTFTVFEIMLKPFIYKMQGHLFNPKIIPLVLGENIKRRKTIRQSTVPVKIVDGIAVPVEYHGSAHINAFVFADGFITIPVGIAELKKGCMAHVRLL